MEEILTRLSRLRRLAVSAFTLSALLSLIAAPPVHAQAPIFSWGGTVEVSTTTTLEIPEGGVGSYDLRLTQQPSDSSRECCGWWVLLRVDTDDTDDVDDKISVTPSVGWEFKRQEGASGPTSWRGISISALEDADDEDETFVFRHEVWDENSECPDSLHPDNLPVVRVRIIDNDRPGNQPRLSILDTSVVEGGTAQFNVSLTSESTQPVTVSWVTADGTAKEGTDYEARRGTLTIPAGETVRQVSVPTVEDDLHEPAERFRVTLSGPSGATLADGTAEATITDDDLPKLSIGNASPVTEGGHGPVRGDVDAAQRPDGHGAVRDPRRHGDGGLGLHGAVGNADVFAAARDDDDLGADHRRRNRTGVGRTVHGDPEQSVERHAQRRQR